MNYKEVVGQLEGQGVKLDDVVCFRAGKGHECFAHFKNNSEKQEVIFNDMSLHALLNNGFSLFPTRYNDEVLVNMKNVNFELFGEKQEGYEFKYMGMGFQGEWRHKKNTYSVQYNNDEGAQMYMTSIITDKQPNQLAKMVSDAQSMHQ